MNINTALKSQQETAWFAASTGLGAVYMGIRLGASKTGANKSIDVIESALLMRSQETAIQSFEDWLKMPLSFVPVPAVPNNQCIKLVYILKDNPRVHGQLLLPLSALPALEQSFEQLSAVMKIQWQPLTAKLQLSNIEVPINQLQKLEAGGLYLLSESFSTEWYAQLELTEERRLKYRVKITANGELKVTQQIKNWSNTQQPVEVDRLQVLLDSPVQIPADRFMTWVETQEVSLQDSLISSDVSLVLKGRKIAVGQLMPLSHGYAVMIKSCGRFV